MELQELGKVEQLDDLADDPHEQDAVQCVHNVYQHGGQSFVAVQLLYHELISIEMMQRVLDVWADDDVLPRCVAVLFSDELYQSAVVSEF